MSLECSDTPASNVQTEEMTGNAVGSIVPNPPINGK